MNPWYALTLGICIGFVAGSLVFIFVSAFLNYGRAVMSEGLIEAELKRRKQENENGKERNQDD